ncbi:MAG: DUF3362 domain-containing protein, partial [Oscillospiraceae bacterium]|nr:DUF3362 domain-containing protein [Oscillospiraceae bacterium]
LYLRDNKIHPEQVQDFYPTPGTISTCMYYTELDPYTMEPVYVPKTPKDKAMQRALLQYFKPENRALVLEALRRAGRHDLIGTGAGCLAAPDAQNGNRNNKGGSGTWTKQSKKDSKQQKRSTKPQRKSQAAAAEKTTKTNAKKAAAKRKFRKQG